MLQAISNTLGMNPAIRAFRIENGAEERIAGHHVRVNIAHKQLVDLELRQNNSVHALATVTAVQLKAFCDYITDTYTAANYRNVKDNLQWRAVYEVTDDVMWSYVSRIHGPMSKSESTVACRACGIVLPLKVITVDHQSPQTGGAVGAICRVFRGLGLTQGGPKGKKNKHAIQANAATVGGKVANLGSWSERYSLNDAGAIYYSVIKEAQQLSNLENACLHHFLNLRPVCGPCNSRLKNSGAF